MEPESKTKTLLQLVFSNSILKCLFRGSRRQLYQKCSNNCCKHDTLLEATPKMKNCVSTALARADRGSDPLEKHTKSNENTTFEPTRQKVQQKGELWESFAVILLAKTHQARDKIALWSHNDPDTTKHYAFHRPRALNTVKHVFWEVQIGTRRRGAGNFWGGGKTTIWHLKVGFY